MCLHLNALPLAGLRDITHTRVALYLSLQLLRCVQIVYSRESSNPPCMEVDVFTRLEVAALCVYVSFGVWFGSCPSRLPTVHL